MATKRSVAPATKRRLALEQELHEVAQLEAEQKIDAALLDNHQYREINKSLKDIAKRLHLARVNASRKAFAIKVRNRRLADIPKEIKRIEKSKATVDRQVKDMERRSEGLIAARKALKDQAEAALRDQGELPTPIAVPA